MMVQPNWHGNKNIILIFDVAHHLNRLVVIKVVTSIVLFYPMVLIAIKASLENIKDTK
jgi:hypothetical protein